MRAIVRESGNGLPGVGDFVSGDDGEVYIVVQLVGPIHTGSHPGVGNYVYAEVELADWADVDDDSEPVCCCTEIEE